MSTDFSTDTFDYINGFFTNPSLIIILVFSIFIYVVIIVYLGQETYGTSNISNYNIVSNTESSGGFNILLTVAIFIFIALIIINGLQYMFGYDIIASIKNIFTGSPEIDIEVHRNEEKPPVPEIMLRKQVFNIPDNNFVYEDAKSICKAYGARLATYEELEDAYKDGAEWCNYGWSEGQMALYPTQEKTWENLQKIEGHENDCGRPGINGGYIANPALRFGVNCYGNKPRMTPTEEDLMATRPVYPKTMKDIALENRVNYWKDKLNEILVSPFNHNNWSRI
jgi:hypothetical protein